MDALYALFVTTLVVFCCLGLGNRLLQMTKIFTPGNYLSNALLAFGAGSGLLSLFILFIGLAGMLVSPFILCILIGGAILGSKTTLQQISGFFRESKSLFDRLGKYNLCLGIIAAYAFLNGAAAATPPLDVDVLNYHLAVPHIYLLQHRILPIPGIYFSYFPFNIQMLYLLCLSLGSGSAAQLLHVVFGLANVGVIACLAYRWYGARTAALAALLFYSLGDVGAETALGRIDLGISFYALMTFFCFIRSQERSPGTLWLIMSGGFAGLCAGSKYTGLIVPGILCSLVFLFSASLKVKKILIVGFMAMLVAGPWYLRNYFWTGNPIFPFFTEYWGQGPLLDEHIQLIQRNNWQYAPIPRTVVNFFLTPWLLIAKREAFASGRIGPLFLAFLPIFVICRWHRLRRLSPLFWFCGLWFPFWFWTSPLLRFLFAPLALLSIPLAKVLRIGLKYRKTWRIGAFCALGFWCLFATTWNVKQHARFIPVALGVISSDIFLDQIPKIEVYHYKDFQYVNTTLEAGQVLIFGSHGLYLQAHFALAADWAIKHWTVVEQGNLQAIQAALQESQITHIMLREDFQSGDPAEKVFFECVKKLYSPLREQAVYSRESVHILRIGMMEDIIQN